MAHVLVRNDHVILGRHVIRQVVVNDAAQQPIEQRQVHLLVDLVKLGLDQYD